MGRDQRLKNQRRKRGEEAGRPTEDSRAPLWIASGAECCQCELPGPLTRERAGYRHCRGCGLPYVKHMRKPYRGCIVVED